MSSRIMPAAILAIGLSILGVSHAEAGWGCYGVATGCHGCYGGAVAVSCCGGYDCYGCYGCHGRPARQARRYARQAACSCYGSCYGCYSSCYGCYSSCHGCYASCYGPTAVIYESGPVYQTVPQAQPAAEPTPAVSPSPAAASRVMPGTATLVVDVPADAKIFVNGTKTSTPGSHRQYVSTALMPGHTYAYEVRAVIERDGEERVVTKHVSLTAGSETRLAFAFPATVPGETAVAVLGSATQLE